jgi:hypothetical protein
VRNFDGNSAAQPGVDGTKDRAHSAFAQLAFDAVWSQGRSSRRHRRLCILQQSRADLNNGAVQKQIVGLPGQQRFHFAAHVRVRPCEQGRSLFGRSLAHRME